MSSCEHLSKKKDVNDVLHDAAGAGHVYCVGVLLKAGADVNKVNDYGQQPIMIAASNGHVECVKALLTAGAGVNSVNERCLDRTVLMCAINEGKLECVQALIHAGADVNMTDRYDDSALSMAYHKNRHIMEVLLKAGADVNESDSCGATFLLQSTGNDVYDGITFNTYHEDDDELECVKLLLRYGADANKTDDDGHTPLMTAAFNVYTRITKELIAAGADVNLVDNEKRTALSNACDVNPYAAAPSCNDCVKQLLRAGAHVNPEGGSENRIHILDEMSETDSFGQSKERVMLLLAAGEATDTELFSVPDDIREEDGDDNDIYVSVNVEDVKQLCTLKGLCREAVRNHLLTLSPVNLFCRIPQLGLPSLIKTFLLYDMSLEGGES